MRNICTSNWMARSNKNMLSCGSRDKESKVKCLQDLTSSVLCRKKTSPSYFGASLDVECLSFPGFGAALTQPSWGLFPLCLSSCDISSLCLDSFLYSISYRRAVLVLRVSIGPHFNLYLYYIGKFFIWNWRSHSQVSRVRSSLIFRGNTV